MDGEPGSARKIFGSNIFGSNWVLQRGRALKQKCKEGQNKALKGTKDAS
jgi:hypothetical protein